MSETSIVLWGYGPTLIAPDHPIFCKGREYILKVLWKVTVLQVSLFEETLAVREMSLLYMAQLTEEKEYGPWINGQFRYSIYRLYRPDSEKPEQGPS